MSFHLDTKKKTGTFYFDYYPIDVHKGNFPIAFAGQANRPNALFEGTKYNVKQIYLSKAIHKIAGVDFDAELILEHAPITSGFKPLYVCIPLKNSGRSTTIDQLGQKDFSLDLNSLIRSYTCVEYTSPGYLYDQTVVVLTTPIYIGADFSKFDVDLFSAHHPDYAILTMAPIRDHVEGFVEAMTQTAYCQPIDTVDPDVAEKADLVIPLDSQTAAGMGISGATQIASGFASYSIAVMFAVFLTPFAYRYMVLGMIRESDEFASADCQARVNRLRSVDMFLAVFAVYTVMSFITVGVSRSDGKMLIMVMFFVAWVILAAVVIQVDKALRGDDILRHLCGKQAAGQTMQKLLENVKPDITDFLWKNFGVETLLIGAIVIGVVVGIYKLPFSFSIVLILCINYVYHLFKFTRTRTANPL